MTLAVYPGSFDPFTLGHRDILLRSLKIFDEIVIAVGVNQNKKTLFSADERVEMIERNLSKFEHNDTDIIVEPFENLLIDKATEVGAQIVIRGLRAVSDFEYEYQLVGMNRAMNDSIETTFLMAEAKHQAIASRLVKEIARLGGDISNFVTPGVEAALKEKFKDKS